MPPISESSPKTSVDGWHGTPPAIPTINGGITMLEQIIIGIQQELSCALNQNQLTLLGQVLTKHLSPVVPSEPTQKAEDSLLPAFIAA